jgi:hypothetical protein
MHQPSSRLWENLHFRLRCAPMMTETKKKSRQQRKCSDRYCINCICVVLISLHFINLIKISQELWPVAFIACKVSSPSFLLLLRLVHHVNYYFNNKRTKTVLKTRIVQSIASCLSSTEAFHVVVKLQPTEERKRNERTCLGGRTEWNKKLTRPKAAKESYLLSIAPNSGFHF